MENLIVVLMLAGGVGLIILGQRLRERRLRREPRAGSTTIGFIVEPHHADRSTIASGDDWIVLLVQALHLLVIGHTRGGKTTLIHEIATRRAAAGARVIVCDPDAAPGLWAGCEVYGYGDDFTAIGRVLAHVQVELGARRQMRGQGQQRQFAPLHVVIDEIQDVIRACEGARALIEDVLRRGGKLGIHLIAGVQDKQVATLKIEGQGDLRKNFGYTVEVRATADGRRWASVTSNGDAQAQTYPIPNLPDLDRLVARTAPTTPAERHEPLFSSPTPTTTTVPENRQKADDHGVVVARGVTIDEQVRILRVALEVEREQGDISRSEVCRRVFEGQSGGAAYNKVKAVLDAAQL